MQFMQSINGRLNVLFVVIVTLVLAALGAYNGSTTKARLERDLESRSKALQVRLQLSLPAAVWNFDKAQIAQILEAEMSDATFNGIVLSNGATFLDGRLRDEQGKVNAAGKDAKIAGATTEADLIFDDNGTKKKVATAKIYVSHASVDEALRSNWLTLVVQIVLLDVILIVALSLSISAVVLKPLKRLGLALGDIASGDADLTRRLTVIGNDEFSRVSQSFNVFVERLQGVMKQVSETAIQLAAAAEETTRITEQAAEGIQQQQRQTDDVVNAVSQLSNEIHEVSSSTAKASEAAAYADSEAEKGQAIVKDTIVTIGDATREVDNAAEVIASLARNSDKIGSVLSVINEIAKQTNLLALNAAIEAARAGEAGRGFAVVADEVRVLANRTHDSTTEIQAVIRELQEGTSQAVMVMGQSKEKADQGLKRAHEAGVAISRLAESAREIAGLDDEIASVTSRQDKMVDEMAESIRRIKQIVVEAANGAQQTSIASEEVAKLAARLQVAVEQFKL
ncbi:MAG: methyl-accepting chemotaxis protein [Burkholderiales bacterium]|nr:methyl-accepting chemotaxis protein [Burkholderiales bacterium]